MTRISTIALATILLSVTTTTAEAKTTGRGYDAITTAGRTVTVQAKFEHSWFFGLWKPDISNKSVKLVFRNQQKTATTDDEGMARASFKAPAQPGTYSYQATYDGVQVTGTMWVLDPQKPLAVFDLDGTLSDMPSWEVPFKGGSAKSFPGAPQLVRDLAKTHQIIYLTARDDSMDSQTRAFLKLHNLPVAPVIYNDWGASGEEKLSAINPANNGKFKLAQLKKLQALGLTVDLGVGNAETDGQAYEGAHVASYLLTTTPGSGFRFQHYSDLRARLISDGKLAPAGTTGLAGSLSASSSHP